MSEQTNPQNVTQEPEYGSIIGVCPDCGFIFTAGIDDAVCSGGRCAECEYQAEKAAEKAADEMPEYSPYGVGEFLVIDGHLQYIPAVVIARWVREEIASRAAQVSAQ